MLGTCTGCAEGMYIACMALLVMCTLHKVKKFAINEVSDKKTEYRCCILKRARDVHGVYLMCYLTLVDTILKLEKLNCCIIDMKT